MDLQYISNENGEKTAVIIPIEEWRHITDKHAELRDLAEKIPGQELMLKKKGKASEYAGTISKEEAKSMHNYLKKARNEWERDF